MLVAGMTLIVPLSDTVTMLSQAIAAHLHAVSNKDSPITFSGTSNGKQGGMVWNAGAAQRSFWNHYLAQVKKNHPVRAMYEICTVGLGRIQYCCTGLTCMKSTGALALEPWPPLCCSTPEAEKRNVATTSPVLPPSAIAHTLAVLSADTVTTCKQTEWTPGPPCTTRLCTSFSFGFFFFFFFFPCAQTWLLTQSQGKLGVVQDRRESNRLL